MSQERSLTPAVIAEIEKRLAAIPNTSGWAVDIRLLIRGIREAWREQEVAQGIGEHWCDVANEQLDRIQDLEGQVAALQQALKKLGDGPPR